MKAKLATTNKANTQEQLRILLLSAYEQGQRAGNLAGYYGDPSPRNPFMSAEEAEEYYG